MSPFDQDHSGHLAADPAPRPLARWGAIGMIMVSESIPAPSLAALAVVGLILLTAHLVWRRLRR
ncbi:MAG TPA: hypothetical protein VM429_14105 [Micropruina sp.]|nr:hypothetical protein [Micropruina sp.]